MDLMAMQQLRIATQAPGLIWPPDLATSAAGQRRGTAACRSTSAPPSPNELVMHQSARPAAGGWMPTSRRRAWPCTLEATSTVPLLWRMTSSDRRSTGQSMIDAVVISQNPPARTGRGVIRWMWRWPRARPRHTDAGGRRPASRAAWYRDGSSPRGSQRVDTVVAGQQDDAPSASASANCSSSHSSWRGRCCPGSRRRDGWCRARPT